MVTDDFSTSDVQKSQKAECSRINVFTDFYLLPFFFLVIYSAVMVTTAIPDPAVKPEESVLDSRRTTCCVVGGGPGGMMLAFLLARQGVPVTLLEAHKDFDRDFRGDTIHPSVLEILDQIGMAEPLLKLRHVKVYGPTLRIANSDFNPIDLRRLKTKFPYIMLLPQTKFLDFLAEEAKCYPEFHLQMVANAGELIEENGMVRGVRYQSTDGWHEVRALLTVGADGRFSKIRHLAGIEPIGTSPPIDILWFHLPHLPTEPDSSDRVLGGVSRGRILVVFDRFEYWQVGFVFPKGHYQELRAAGLEAFRRSIVEVEPRFADHVSAITDWRQCSLLSVESSRCPVWWKPGLLLIGDAAHVMSPVGGVGINYAIQDAVVAANLLTEKLKRGQVGPEDLARVQKEREWPTRVIQALQSFVQKRLIAAVLTSQNVGKIPWSVRLFFHIPYVRDIPARVIAFGVKRVRLSPELLNPNT
jgi:2-polyprenyl-6-methoxyphenol hydroxylase-like FAD-dependent oxidoreductase